MLSLVARDRSGDEASRNRAAHELSADHDLWAGLAWTTEAVR